MSGIFVVTDPEVLRDAAALKILDEMDAEIVIPADVLMPIFLESCGDDLDTIRRAAEILSWVGGRARLAHPVDMPMMSIMRRGREATPLRLCGSFVMSFLR